MAKILLEVALFAFWLWLSLSEYRNVMIERVALVAWVTLAAWLIARWIVGWQKRGWLVYPVVTLAAIAAVWFLRPSEPAGAESPRVALFMRYAGQWPGYTNAERVELNESVKLTMRIGETQELHTTVAGSVRLSNVSLEMCIPRKAFKVETSAAWEAADPDPGPTPWNDCDRYSTYFPLVNEGQGLNPRTGFRFQALVADTFTFRFRISTFQTPVTYGQFQLTVRP